MSKRLLVGLLLSLCVITSGLVQEVVASSPNLELRLEPGEVQKDVPHAFTFTLVNKSNHDIRIPVPSINCGDNINGFIWLRLHLVPLKPSSGGLVKGCSSSSWHWPSILERAKQWKVIHAGESLHLQADRRQLSYESKQPGTYEFWADYFPPFASPDDQAALASAGIDFPHEKLSSAHVTFRMKP